MWVRVPPSANTGEQVMSIPQVWGEVKVGVRIPHRPQKKSKKCLTNHQKCDIIKIQMRDARQKPARWQDPRESRKTLTIKSSTARGVGVRNTNVNQTVQAETMSRISLLPQATPLSACVAQLVEQRAFNPWVGGSSPFAGTTFVYQSSIRSADGAERVFK